MAIYILRHTKPMIETGICYGQTDVPLAPSSAQEFELIRQKLRGKSFSRIFSSPLALCRELAESIFPENQLIFDARLMEMDFGDWEMQAWDKIQNDDYGKIWMKEFIHLPAQNGESYDILASRVFEFYQEYLQDQVDDVLIITHVSVIRALYHMVEQIPISSLFKTSFQYGDFMKLDQV